MFVVDRQISDVSEDVSPSRLAFSLLIAGFCAFVAESARGILFPAIWPICERFSESSLAFVKQQRQNNGQRDEMLVQTLTVASPAYLSVQMEIALSWAASWLHSRRAESLYGGQWGKSRGSSAIDRRYSCPRFFCLSVRYYGVARLLREKWRCSLFLSSYSV